jgi:hypothetical protein
MYAGTPSGARCATFAGCDATAGAVASRFCAGFGVSGANRFPIPREDARGGRL